MADPISLVVSLADQVTGPATKMAESMAGMADKASGMGSAFEALGASGGPITMAVVAIVAVTGALAAVTIAMAAFSIQASGAKQKALAMFSALGGGAAQGQALLAMVDDLGNALGMTREQLSPWAEKLLAAGVAGHKLEDSLRAVAGANALVSGGGDKVTSMLAKLNEQGMKGSKVKFSPSMLVGTGLTEQDLMTALGMTPRMFDLAKKQGTITGAQLSDAIVKSLATKGAGPLAQQANTLTAAWDKLKENVTQLFEDVDPGPFIASLRDIFGLFSKDTASGKAMHDGITGAMNGLFKAAAKVLPYIKTGIEIVILWSLKLYVYAKQHWGMIQTALKGVAVVMGIVAVAALVAALPFIAMAAGLVLVGVAVAALGAGIMWLVGKLLELPQAIHGMVNGALAKLTEWANSAGDFAKNFIQGLIDGIAKGTGLVGDAIKGLGTSAMTALKNVLGIHSPSKEFEKLGGHVAAGFAQGMANADVSQGAASMGTKAKAATARSGGAPAGGGARGVIANFMPGAIVIQGAGKDAEELSEQLLSLALERVALSQGLG